MAVRVHKAPSEFVGHGPCPDCGSSDARAKFTDGHYYCFSCRKFTPPVNGGGVATIERTFTFRPEVLNREKQKIDVGTYGLPDDLSNSIHSIGLEWLRKYGITEHEIAIFNFGWSIKGKHIPKTGTLDDGTPIEYGYVHCAPLLCYLLYNADGKFVGWQGRNFSNLPKAPKYVGRKNPNETFLIRNKEHWKNTLVVVEDYVSAIKVSRVASAMPLLRSTMGQFEMALLAREFKRLMIWLDPDATLKALDIQKAAELHFEKVEMIATNRDPKGFSTEVIETHIIGEDLL